MLVPAKDDGAGFLVPSWACGGRGPLSRARTAWYVKRCATFDTRVVIAAPAGRSIWACREEA